MDNMFQVSKKRILMFSRFLVAVTASFSIGLFSPNEHVQTVYAESGNYYVAPNGNDSWNGQYPEYQGGNNGPWKTPEKAASTAMAGETVFFRGGKYYGKLIPKNSGNSTDGWIVFKSYPGETPVIIHDAYYSRPIYIDRVNYIELNGLTGEAVGKNGPGIGVNNAHHVKILNCTARNSGGAGISATNGKDHLLIEGNTVYGNTNRSDYDGSGVSMWNSGCLFPEGAGDTCELMNDGSPGYHVIIRNNFIYDNRNIEALSGRLESDGNGIIMDNNGPNNPLTLIENNVIFHNGGRCIHNFNSAHIDIFNNTCYHNQETPRLSSSGEISLSQTSDSTFDIKVRNNVVYSNHGGAALAIYGDPHITPDEYDLDYNLWYNGTINIRPLNLGGKIGEHAITGQDPQYVNPTLDPATADFHLQGTSPAIDRGTDEFASVTTHDFDDVPRPQGAGYDIGAYEYQDGSSQSIFVDVPLEHPYHGEIEALYEAGYTAGCNTNPLMYCPEKTMDRAESAVFVERGIHGVDSIPSEPAEQIFTDVPLGIWTTKWATALWNDGYTAGCGTDPLIYCPWREHTRAEGAVFYLRMLHGAEYLPPDASGIFDDVPLDRWYADWVEKAYQDGILPACSQDPLKICPDDPLSRGLAAYMMVQAKGLPLP